MHDAIASSTMPTIITAPALAKNIGFTIREHLRRSLGGVIQYTTLTGLAPVVLTVVCDYGISVAQ